MFMRFADTLTGSEATATINIDGKIETMFYIKTLEARFEKNKAEGKTLGKRATQYKATGWNGSGSMTVYYVTSTFRKLAQRYAETGQDVYFDITVENNDPTSSVGKQTASLTGCNLDSTLIAAIDVEAESLEEDLDFTFEGFSIIDEFGQPVLAQ
jgi:hypothetical protein